MAACSRAAALLSLSGVWCTAQACCCFHNRGGGSTQCSQHLPHVSKISDKEELSNLCHCFSNVPEICYSFFYSFSSYTLTCLFLVFLLGSVNIAMHRIHFLPLTISILCKFFFFLNQRKMSDVICSWFSRVLSPLITQPFKWNALANGLRMGRSPVGGRTNILVGYGWEAMLWRSYIINSTIPQCNVVKDFIHIYLSVEYLVLSIKW